MRYSGFVVMGTTIPAASVACGLEDCAFSAGLKRREDGGVPRSAAAALTGLLGLVGVRQRGTPPEVAVVRDMGESRAEAHSEARAEARTDPHSGARTEARSAAHGRSRGGTPHHRSRHHKRARSAASARRASPQ